MNDSYFERRGFETGEVVMPGLEITVELGSGTYFRDDGVVRDLYEHHDRLTTEFNCFELSNAPSQTTHKGWCIGLTDSSSLEKASVIFVEDSGPVGNIFIKGHESTHALIFLGHSYALVDELESEGFSLNPFERYSNEEWIAHIGGILAWHKAGLLGPTDLDKVYSPFIKDLFESKV
jgi:hypothetical protein